MKVNTSVGSDKEFEVKIKEKKFKVSFFCGGVECVSGAYISINPS